MGQIVVTPSRWPPLAAICCLVFCLRIGAVARTAASNSSVFDEGQARLRLQFYAVGVCAPQRIEAWRCGAACNATRPFTLNGSQRVFGPTHGYQLQGYAVRLEDERRPDRCMLVFTGTSFYNPRNILADALFWTEGWPKWHTESGRCAAETWCADCGVHYGFAQAYAELRAPFLQVLEEMSCRSVEVAGHSLGGVMAMLASMELRACHSERFTVEQVWTFGMPRVGNAAFAEKYVAVAEALDAEPPMWRVVHAEDLIPMIPPYWLGFRHAPLEIYYPTKDASVFKVCPPGAGALENSGCGLAVSQGTMKDHHAYLGRVIQTDENKVSEDCIPAAVMGPKQFAWNAFCISTALVLVALCAVPCFLCCSLCCGCLRKRRRVDADAAAFKSLSDSDMSGL